MVFRYTGNGTFIYSGDPEFDSTVPSSIASVCGRMRGFTVDGTSAGADAVGFQVGDQNNPDVNIGVQNFTGASAIGFYADSKRGWFTGGTISAALSNNANCAVFDNTSTLNLMFGTTWIFNTLVNPGQNGYKWVNGAQVCFGSFTSTLNAIAGTANAGTAFSFGADNSGAGMLQVAVNCYSECDEGTGTVGPVSMVMGTGGTFYQCIGTIGFQNSSGQFQSPSGTAAYQSFVFSGTAVSNVTDDPLGAPAGFALVAMGGSLGTSCFSGGGVIYNQEGDYSSLTLDNGANSAGAQLDIFELRAAGSHSGHAARKRRRRDAHRHGSADDRRGRRRYPVVRERRNRRHRGIHARRRQGLRDRAGAELPLMTSLQLLKSVTVVLDGDGNGTCPPLGPSSYGETWTLSGVSLQASSNAAEASGSVYLNGSLIGTTHLGVHRRHRGGDVRRAGFIDRPGHHRDVDRGRPRRHGHDDRARDQDDRLMLKFAHDVAGGQGNLIIASLQSPNFVDQVSGWQVTKAGDAQFNNVETRGSFYGFEFIINDSGAFFYTGTPAHGNLQASIASTAGTDPFTNPYGAGFNLYGPGGTLQLINNSSAPAVIWTPAGAAHVTTQPQVWSQVQDAGLASEFMFMLLESGKESGLDDAALQLFSEAADGSIAARAILEFGGAIALTVTKMQITPGVPIVADSWHVPTSLSNGWVNQGGGNVPFKYRLTPTNEVEVIGVVNGASASSSTFFTLPSGYVPATQQPPCTATSTEAGRPGSCWWRPAARGPCRRAASRPCGRSSATSRSTPKEGNRGRLDVDRARRPGGRRARPGRRDAARQRQAGGEARRRDRAADPDHRRPRGPASARAACNRAGGMTR